ncbi:hypothetical protein [Novosphingobium pentaromativorans]|uniref:Uncharacterized protein n=1 Tax=Novosphingobium pentaromativorans US6-1 TaxID=1088721 RepID=G6E9J6_9SPHN|nr:hypothetical protein [Novosphingobium pentaromativorans]AIT80997.1 hypothetical protein JI59_15015 [Novosphingobium pentaromativorans US6-1]EHJ62013.1 hypothetical protein NSU_1017 [Novosphingobium pentaromativorans US6-1]
MSDRLTISACFSILMMAAYVLFGEHVAREPLGPDQFMAGTEFSANVETPELLGSPGDLFKLAN